MAFRWLYRADTKPGRNSCPWLQFVVQLSFPNSNQPCFIVMFLFLADQIFQILRIPASFSFAVACIISVF